MTAKRLKPQLRQQLWECQTCGEIKETYRVWSLVAESKELALFCQQCGMIKRHKEIEGAEKFRQSMD